MSLSFAPKVLADGQLANSKTTIYTAPVSPATSTYPAKLFLFSTTAITQTVAIFLKPAATSRQIKQLTLAQNGSYEIDLRGLTIETGDLIEASTTTALAVDFVLTGLEET